MCIYLQGGRRGAPSRTNPLASRVQDENPHRSPSSILNLATLAAVLPTARLDLVVPHAARLSRRGLRRAHSGSTELSMAHRCCSLTRQAWGAQALRLRAPLDGRGVVAGEANQALERGRGSLRRVPQSAYYNSTPTLASDGGGAEREHRERSRLYRTSQAGLHLAVSSSNLEQHP